MNIGRLKFKIKRFLGIGKKKTVPISEVIANSELVKLAIIEAIHRHYYDNILADTMPKSEVVKLGILLGNASCMYPDWRGRIVDYIDKKYKWETYPNEVRLIQDMPICSKPKKIVPLVFKLSVNVNRK